jgi:hypothetical protein
MFRPNAWSTLATSGYTHFTLLIYSSTIYLTSCLPTARCSMVSSISCVRPTMEIRRRATVQRARDLPTC